MKNILTTLAVITYSFVSCVEDAKSYNCSDLNELKSVFENRQEKNEGIFIVLKYATSKNSFEAKVADSLIELEKQFDKLKSNINNKNIETISLNLKNVINKIDSLPYKDFKEPLSISRIKKETIEELKALKNNFHQKKCNSYNELKILSIQENLFHKYLENSFAIPYYFNSIQPYVYSKSNKFNQGDSISIEVGFKAQDTTENTKIKYWIDDSSMKEINLINHNSNTPIILKGKKGNHKAVGFISVKQKGIQKWKKWEYEYVIE